ncbi:DUF3833 domain-containing protein [Agaribacter flavus]|uniref:DUF3833 domain-containing protein n=1 Tax=Agaribacter flavus TaxID=1902781 RepID=A0ABV7FL32_9ALTE
MITQPKKSTMSLVRAVLLGITMLTLTACSISIEGESYEDISPKFDLASFFTGEVKAWGIVQNRSGELVQRFTVSIVGDKQDDKLILDEVFEYGFGDGPKTRVWTIQRNADGTFSGSAGDIAGSAKGISYGNAFNFAYEMDLQVNDTTYRVNFDDWFWAFDDSTIMNRSYIKKFGIVMAEVTIFMQKQ